MTEEITKLPEGPGWTFGDLEKYNDIMKDIADNVFKLTYFPNQIEIITSEQMLDAYAFIGLPIVYNHWRYGKHYSANQHAYKKGKMNLAYEMVINSSPCISYLMEENNLVTQALVIAHACYGHNSFFKNNFLFKEWTDPGFIVDYMIWARDYVAECEDKYGYEQVEQLLDACHILEYHGIDKYKRPPKLSPKEEKDKQKERMEDDQKYVSEFWNVLPKIKEEKKEDEDYVFPKEPQENILNFLQKNSPILKPWQREVIRIVRNVSQYFYPQSQTKVMNEGWASFMHYNIIREMEDRGHLTESFMLDFMKLHTNVLWQEPAIKYVRTHDGRIKINPETGQPEKYLDIYTSMNPYSLGFEIFKDIRRICENPTDEDKEWFPEWAGDPDWLKICHWAMEEFKDESFILQFLSPHLIRKFNLFNIHDESRSPLVEVTEISNDDGYRDIRRKMSHTYNRAYQIPDVQVTNANILGDRELTLTHYQVNNVPLHDKDKKETIEAIKYLWGFDVNIILAREDD